MIIIGNQLGTVLEFISQPWHWSISGMMIVIVMVLLLWFGGEFGVSSNLRTMCAMSGLGKSSEFFNFDWKAQIWNLVFIGGAVIGGFIASNFLASPDPVHISTSTQTYLQSIGINTPQSISEGTGFVPMELFSIENVFNLRGIVITVVGGFLIGFGTRWAGGCTSGHAISGLANLQIPSLIAVVGFFIGGLLMTFVFLPQILTL